MYFLISIFILTITLISICFYIYIRLAKKFNLIDKPNDLSKHYNSIPTGSGIILVTYLIIFFLLCEFLKTYYDLNILFPNRYYLIFGSVFLLGLISFYDDIKNVHFFYRLTMHFFVVLISTPLFSYLDLSFPNFFPQKLSLIVFVFLYVYIINIYNFIDGSDGYLSVNALAALISYCCTYNSFESLDFDFYLSFFMIACLMGYLFFNKPNAKIFLGDSGSIVIGYIIGYLFFILILKGFWGVALAIIIYPFMDVSLTIIRKMKNGYNPWERLFDYFFLRALNSDNTNHLEILLTTLTYNIINLLIIISIIYFDLQLLVVFSFIISLVKILFFNKLIKVTV